MELKHGRHVEDFSEYCVACLEQWDEDPIFVLKRCDNNLWLHKESILKFTDNYKDARQFWKIDGSCSEELNFYSGIGIELKIVIRPGYRYV